MEKKEILLVDDEQEITDLLEVYLLNEGYKVHKFYSAEKVMECIETHKISLAILDVMLPDTDGFTLCQKIRKNWFFPIIMLTAKIEDMDKIKGITMGADDYITKPFNPLEVVARVKGQIRRTESYNRSLSDMRIEKIEEEGYYNVRGLEIWEKSHESHLYGKEIPFTPIEFSIILYLCKHINQVVSSEELFEAVWGGGIPR